MKMSKDLLTNLVVATNYESLCDVETMMGLTCVLPMLEAVQSLNKLAQNTNYFNSDFVVSFKLTSHVDLHSLYVDLERHFSHDQLQSFVDLVEFKYDVLPTIWYP
jgi:hypothetical protein